MLLRKFDVYGFKSFADHTELDMSEGITAIVGPNGSGKSNIADAIRWVLGEQSVRSLRGSKMEDIIFAGSAKRRPLGVAEVSLTFDNTDGTLPIDFNEVIITRRLFRSGEGEFFINKAPCRLKDIHELFADTGLGRDGMAIISQNKVDEFLNSKPDERRFLFEEAAGIAKYRQRKREATRKLDNTEQNLTRVADILAELKSQAESLSESAERTQKYNILAVQLKTCQAAQLLTKLDEAEEMVASAKQGQEALQAEELSLTTTISNNDIVQERCKQDLKQCNTKLAEHDRELAAASTKLEQLKGQQGILEERIRQYQATAARSEAERKQTLAHLTDNADKTAVLSALLTEKQAAKDEAEQCLIAKNIQYEKAAAVIEQMSGQLESSRDATLEQLQDIVSSRNEYKALEKATAQQEQHQQELASNAVASGQRLQTANSELAGFTSALAEADEKLNGYVQELTDKAKVQDSCLQELAVQQKNVEKSREQLQNAAAKYKALQSMQNELEGFNRGIKHILRSTLPWRQGICGAVAQLLDVPEQYVTAVEIALGGALQNIVTIDDKTAQSAIRFLKEQRLGRATFLPLTSIRPFRPGAREQQAAKMAGAIGLAATLVSCAPAYEKIAEYLLGRTIIAVDMPAAVKIAASTGYTVKIVTLEGEIITPGGAMTGGSIYRKDAGFLSRRNELEKMASILAGLRETAAAAQTVKTALQARADNIAAEIEAIQHNKQQLLMTQAQLTIRQEKAVSEQQAATQQAAVAKTAAAAAVTTLAELKKEFTASAAQVAKLEKLDLAHKQHVEKCQQELKSYFVARDALAASITETKLIISGLDSELAMQEARQDELAAEKLDIEANLAECIDDITAISAQITTTQAEITAVCTAQQQTVAQLDEYQQQRQHQHESKLAIMAELQKSEQAGKARQRRLNYVQTGLRDAEVLAAKYEYEIERSRESLEEIGFTVGKAREIADSAEQQEPQSIDKLRQAIASLGAVNPAAIEEYEKFNERWQFMQAQYADLIKGRDYLLSIISDIDGTMSKKFKTAFSEISAYFSEIFIALFGGGEADIKLMEPADPLTTGIDVFVQPPGKKMQNLALLSGGERALTVIALLFAILRYKPAPFSVLDEIDAALDEANVARFGKFLRDYGQHTQFIVVTHRKGTMEAADVMHGVTMEESGVSKLLSVKFMDTAV